MHPDTTSTPIVSDPFNNTLSVIHELSSGLIDFPYYLEPFLSVGNLRRPEALRESLQLLKQTSAMALFMMQLSKTPQDFNHVFMQTIEHIESRAKEVGVNSFDQARFVYLLNSGLLTALQRNARHVERLESQLKLAVSVLNSVFVESKNQKARYDYANFIIKQLEPLREWVPIKQLESWMETSQTDEEVNELDKSTAHAITRAVEILRKARTGPIGEAGKTVLHEAANLILVNENPDTASFREILSYTDVATLRARILERLDNAARAAGIPDYQAQPVTDETSAINPTHA